jgi:hypothetical protein
VGDIEGYPFLGLYGIPKCCVVGEGVVVEVGTMLHYTFFMSSENWTARMVGCGRFTLTWWGVGRFFSIMLYIIHSVMDINQAIQNTSQLGHLYSDT